MVCPADDEVDQDLHQGNRLCGLGSMGLGVDR